MSFKKCDWYISTLTFLFSSACFFLVGLLYYFFGGFVGLVGSGPVEFFSFDYISLVLSLLSLVLMFSLVPSLWNQSSVCKFLIVVSIFFSLLCYVSIHGLAFWVSYELSILSLLVLVILESPYSERFIAFWYFAGYIVFTSLPSLLCIMYLGFFYGSFNLCFWNLSEEEVSSEVLYPLIVLGVLFITKIPLIPFHSWLPIVHSDASSIVSVCLSGYIMKLGVLGLCRFSLVVLPCLMFNSFYVYLVLWFSVYFFLASCCELDIKRWLAFMSLSHICVVCLCLGLGDYMSSSMAMLYCLGHGVSAGLLFILSWMFSDLVGSRNWAVLKFCLGGGNVFLRGFVFICFCTCACVPPTVQFFVELSIIGSCGSMGYMFSFLFYVFLVLSGLVPISLVGCLISRHYSVGHQSGSFYPYVVGSMWLSIWCFVVFLLF